MIMSLVCKERSDQMEMIVKAVVIGVLTVVIAALGSDRGEE